MAEKAAANHAPAQRPGHLSVTTTTAEGIHVLTVAGEIDHHSGEALRQALDFPSAPRLRAVIDLHQVTFMDSSGINILLAAHQTLTASDGWLRLAAPTEPVLRTLQIVGIDTIIDCRPTLNSALEN
ncbi:STAS domain-containing protein [Streptomyces sp. NPDC089424]|uniref:STAS domain-containing protein n=1 Tax=Streptomyces sp. NPDC089424 TaxID=3365917 RepID=UPI00381EA274